MAAFDAALVDGRRRPDEAHRWKPSAARRSATRVAVFTRDSWTCQGCGRRFDHDLTPEVLAGRRAPVVLVPRPGEFDLVIYLELHHVVPYRRGGEFKVSNLLALCSSCNVRGRFERAPAEAAHA